MNHMGTSHCRMKVSMEEEEEGGRGRRRHYFSSLFSLISSSHPHQKTCGSWVLFLYISILARAEEFDKQTNRKKGRKCFRLIPQNGKENEPEGKIHCTCFYTCVYMFRCKRNNFLVVYVELHEQL